MQRDKPCVYLDTMRYTGMHRDLVTYNMIHQYPKRRTKIRLCEIYQDTVRYTAGTQCYSEIHVYTPRFSEIQREIPRYKDIHQDTARFTKIHCGYVYKDTPIYSEIHQDI